MCAENTIVAFFLRQTTFLFGVFFGVATYDAVVVATIITLLLEIRPITGVINSLARARRHGEQAA